MKKQDYIQSTLFREDSRANHSVLPGSKEARTMTVTSGQKCCELYGKYSQLGSLVKTCLESSIWHSTRCYLTWKTKDTPAKRLVFRLAVSTPRIKEKGFVFWPTPSTGAALCGGTGNWKTLKAMKEAGLITEEERRYLSQGNGGKTNPELLEWLMGYEKAFTALVPTPTARDYKGAPLGRFYTHTHTQEQIPEQPPRAGGSHSAWENWPDEPGILGIFDGISTTLDEIGGLSNEAKTRAREILCDVWDEVGAETLQWNLGRFQPISKPEILFAFLCEYEERSYCCGTSVESRTVARECVRNLRCEGETSSASHRREYQSQCAGEYSNAVHFLSRKAPSLVQTQWDDYSWGNVGNRVISNCPNRVDRIKCLGNAVVPQQFYPFFAAIKQEIERTFTDTNEK